MLLCSELKKIFLSIFINCRCVAFLLQLSNLYVQCGQDDDCQGSLAKVQLTLRFPEDGSKTRRKDASADSQDTHNSCDDDDDDDFIRTKRISISTECTSRTMLLTETTSSPSLRTQTIKRPSYLIHLPDCFCVSCMDVSLHAQEMRLFLRTAQCLELQGKPTQALTNLQAAIDLGEWCAKKTPSLLSKSCSSLQNGKTMATKKEKGKKIIQKSDLKSRRCACDIHVETITEVYVSMAVLHLLNRSLSQAEKVINRGLDLSKYGSVPKLWLQFYEILVSLELKAEGMDTTVKDLISSTWDVQSNIKHYRDIESSNEDISFQFDQLDLGKPSSKPPTQFQDSVFADRMQRPEVSRKLSEKVSELGIFCDMSDSDNSDKTPNVESSIKCARKTVVKETPKNVALNTKKGSVMFSVRKKKPAKNIWKDAVTPQVETASTAVFDFDVSSPIKAKKVGTRGKSSRQTKSTVRKATTIIDLDSDIDEVFEEKIETKSSKTRSKRTATAKKSAKKVVLNVDLEHSNLLENENEKVDESKSLRKSRKAIEEYTDSTVKPRRGRKPQAETELPEPKTSSTRPKRGRKPNVETLRSEAMTQVSNDILSDLHLTCLEVDSPVKACKPSPSLNLNFEVNTSAWESFNCVQLSSHVSNSNSLTLEDVDEIEIPRAGRGSDSDESTTSLTVRRKTARKPAASRKKTTKKCNVYDVELPRAADSTPMDAKIVRGNTKRSITIDGVNEAGSAQSGQSK